MLSRQASPGGWDVYDDVNIDHEYSAADDSARSSQTVMENDRENYGCCDDS